MKTWHLLAWLIVTAVALYYAKWPILILAAFVLVVRGWVWLAFRYPLTMHFIAAFIRGLLGRRW